MTRSQISIIPLLVIGLVCSVMPREVEAQPARYQGRTFSEWQADLRDLSPSIRERAAAALGYFGSQAVPLLRSVLRDSDPSVRATGLVALERIGSPAVPILAKTLAGPDVSVRAGAARVLGRIGPAAKDSVGALARALNDAQPEVRKNAAWALGRIGPGATGAVPALARALNDTDLEVKESAAVALGEMGPSKEAVEALSRALDAGGRVRGAAARALGRVGATAGDLVVPVIPKLVRLLDDDDVALAVRNLGPITVPGLVGVLTADSRRVRVRAAQLLGEFGPAARDAIGPLVQALSGDYYLVRNVAAEALVAIGPDSVPALTRQLDQGPTEARTAAAWALGEFGAAAQSAVPMLVRIRDSHPYGKVGKEGGPMFWGGPTEEAYFYSALEEALKKIRGSR